MAMRTDLEVSTNNDNIHSLPSTHLAGLLNRRIDGMQRPMALKGFSNHSIVHAIDLRSPQLPISWLLDLVRPSGILTQGPSWLRRNRKQKLRRSHLINGYFDNHRQERKELNLPPSQ